MISHGNVRVEFVDPRDDKDLEKEANEVYAIKSFPFRVADCDEAGVVNSYFSLLLKYGDQHEVLGFDELIEVQATEKNVQVKLRTWSTTSPSRSRRSPIASRRWTRCSRI